VSQRRREYRSVPHPKNHIPADMNILTRAKPPSDPVENDLRRCHQAFPKRIGPLQLEIWLAEPKDERLGVQILIKDDLMPNTVMSDSSSECGSQEGHIEGGEVFEAPSPCPPGF
jgi:hypothetical protein